MEVNDGTAEYNDRHDRNSFFYDLAKAAVTGPDNSCTVSAGGFATDWSALEKSELRVDPLGALGPVDFLLGGK